MAVSSTYKCDICGKLKAEVNHWYVGSEISPANEGDVSADSLGIHRWPKYRDAAGAKHLCGAECVIKYVNEFLGKA